LIALGEQEIFMKRLFFFRNWGIMNALFYGRVKMKSILTFDILKFAHRV